MPNGIGIILMMLFQKGLQGAITKETDKSAKPVLALPRKQAWLVWCCQCLNIAVIAVEISHWMLIVIALCLLWQALHLGKKTRYDNEHNHLHPKDSNASVYPKTFAFLPSLALVSLALLGCLAIALSAKQVGLLASMVHLMCFSYALKSFELKARRDFYQLFLLGIFVLASSLIFRQDLGFTLLTIVLLIINLLCLIQFFSAENSLTKDVKTVVILLAQSTVLAIMLFLFFPRISPFWQMPLAKSAQTGLSDSVKPGDLAKLARSNKLAFRASFEQNNPPLYSQLYWRAMVLEKYDGRQWTKSNFAVNYQASDTKRPQQVLNALTFDETTTQLTPLTYQVIFEPSFQKHLVTLAPAVYQGNETSIIPDIGYSFSSTSTITQPKPYTLTSYLSAIKPMQLGALTRKQNLSYPQLSNPRLEKMARQLQLDYPDVQHRAQVVLSMINEGEYFYTLESPMLQNNSLDQFFFDTQAGFCVHYASAFTFVMRASGIPARMVTGYLGGEYNGTTNERESGSEGHLSVYQYDAHAWSEIWVEDRGWIRVDPTSAVNPERVNSGFSNELLQQRSTLNNELISLYQFKNIAWLNTLRLQFDALDYQWTRWVIGFDSEQQYDLFKRWFGDKAPWKLAVIIGGSLIVSMLLLMLILQLKNSGKRKQQNLTQWQRTYQKALKALDTQGISKPLSMTAGTFAKQVRLERPELAIIFTNITNCYNSLSYQQLSASEQDKFTLMMKQQYLALMKKLK